MRPTGKKVLILQDTIIEDTVNISESGLVIGGGNVDALAEEISKNKNFHFNAQELDDLSSDIKAQTKQEQKITKLNTGTIMFIGAKVDREEMNVGDKVEFSPYGHTTKVYEGIEYLLMGEDGVILNLSRD